MKTAANESAGRLHVMHVLKERFITSSEPLLQLSVLQPD
jgi:hypothetical protein